MDHKTSLTVGLALVAGLLGGLASSYLMRMSVVRPDGEGVLRLRGLIVEDQNGHERIRLGAPLPDPMVHGVRQKRSGAVSGLIISDADGNERGGYTTSDKSGEAFLGLDSEDEQQVLLLANPKGGVNFVLFDSKGNGAQITVFPDGPRLTLTKAGKTISELPK